MRLTPLLLIACALDATAFAASPPPCEYADVPAPPPPTGEWQHVLVDTTYRLPADFVPAGLLPVQRAGLGDDRLLIAPAVADLADLLSAAEKEGLRFELQSAYRSFEYQERVFSGWVTALGMDLALRTSARPGHSEHQLGTALDLRSAGGPAPWDLEDWASTPEGNWLQEKGWRFGFVMSYPEGKDEVTCYAYEPWHYRWLGRETASQIHSSGLTIREWLWRESESEDTLP
jgi:D-alanyl-D-alanine carboxypeptidase